MSDPSGNVISLHGIRVLIVEDVNSISALVSKFMTNYGAQDVEVVKTVGGAWQALQRNDYDIVLLDYMLSGEIGLPLLDLIRDSEEEALMRLAVIVLTATKAKDLMERSIDAGADGYLAKPVPPDRLADRMLQAIEARRTRAERALAERAAAAEAAADDGEESEAAGEG